jgi:hypothetical protein
MKLFFIGATFSLNDEIVPLMKEFFLKPFRKKKTYFQFAHEVDLDYNDMFKFAEIFDNPAGYEIQKITKHLFEQFNHPHIKMEKFMLLI